MKYNDSLENQDLIIENQNTQENTQEQDSLARILYGSVNINESDSIKEGKEINCNNKWKNTEKEVVNDKINQPLKEESYLYNLDKLLNDDDYNENDENKKEESLKEVNPLAKRLENSSSPNINESDSFIGKEINCNTKGIKQREEKGKLNIIAIKTVKMEENGKKKESKNKIIYHDGNLNSENPEIKKNLKYIYKDHEFFMAHIDPDIELSKNYAELKEKIKKDDQKINMIINGKDCEDVIKKLKGDKLYDLINFICVYTSRRKIYEPLKNKYPKIKLITTKKSSIVKFFKTEYPDFSGNSKTLLPISSNFIDEFSAPPESFNGLYDSKDQQALIN